MTRSLTPPPGGSAYVGTKRWKALVPPHLQEPLAKALTAMEAKDLKTALFWFGKCAEIEPFSKPVLYFGATCASQAYFGLRGAGTEADPEILDGWRECAETLTKAAYEVAPDDAVACHNVGRFVQDCGRDAEAIDYYEAALKLDPTQCESWANLGTAYAQLGNLPRATTCWDRAIAFEPKHASGSLAQSYIYLRREQYTEGWAKFEARWQDQEFAQGYGRKDLAGVQWHGEPLKKGDAILFHGEQGLGDHVQFARFVLQAQERGIPVFGVETRPQLKRWMAAALPGIDIFIRDVDKPTGYTHHAALMSLPFALGTTIDTIPAPVAPPVAFPKVMPGAGKKVGIAWHGAAGNPADEIRSMPTELLGQLAETPGVTWVNLQYDTNAGMQARAWLGDTTVDGTEGCRDVWDTAHVIAGLDAVVTVDTLTAHLAGSLGVPTLLMQRFNREWRWGSDRTDSPWYPSVTQITQAAPMDWSNVLDEVKRRLADG